MPCCSLERRRVAATRMACLLAAICALLALPAAGRAAEVETRDFRVLVDGKPAGEAHMTFNRADDGATTMSCDTDVKVSILFITYVYSYRGREIWKDGRLLSFESKCNDDGKLFEVVAAAQNQNLRIRVKAGNRVEERMAPGDVWLTSYWSQPSATVVNKTVPIIDADNGRDLSGKVVYVGAETDARNGPVQHYRLESKSNVDLWYDASGRLVRQDWVEQSHRTVLELARIRR